MIIDKIGDILHTEADVICHQVNCKGVMGAGLAKQIRNQLLSFIRINVASWSVLE